MMSQDIWVLNENAMYSQLRRAQTVAYFLNLESKDFVLDVGCGEGYVTSYFSKSDFVVGMDRSKASLLTAKRKTQKIRHDFILSDITALPLKKESFNKITLLEVLEHLTEEKQKRLCSEINSVLKKEGNLLISVPYKEKITCTNCIHCGKLTPLWGHLSSCDEKKISGLLPRNYKLTNTCHLHNISFISLSRLFRRFPIKIWILLNNALGRVSNGYWIILKYKKSSNAQ